MKLNYLISLLIVLAITIHDSLSTDIKQFECQFTDGLCNWSNDTNDWLLGDYSDKSFGKPVEPLLDGGYVYVGQDNFNHYHEIISPSIEIDVKPFCLKFGYYMFGSDIGQLSLRIIDDSSDAGWVELDADAWKRQGSQLDDWSIGKYHFNAEYKNRVRIGFIATSSNIALGPIQVKSGSCDYNDFCDFEDLSACFWLIEPDYQSNFAWYVSDGKSSSSSRSPLTASTDSTTQTESGKYLRTPDDGQIDSKTVLTTNIQMDSHDAKCLTFGLYKQDKNSDLVEVSLSMINQTGSKTIWTSSSVKADSKWQLIEIALNQTQDDFNILITAHKHDAGQSPVAIDDLKISPKPCHKIGCTFDDENCFLSITKGPLLIGFGRLSNSEALNYSMDLNGNTDRDNFFLYTDTPIEDKSVQYQFETTMLPSIDLACLSFRYFIDSIDPEVTANYLFEIIVGSSKDSSSNKYEPAIVFGQWASVEYILTNPDSIMFNLIAESKLFAGFDDIQLIGGSCSSEPSPSPNGPKIAISDDFNNQLNWFLWKTFEQKKYSDSKPNNERGYPLADPFGNSGNYIGFYSENKGIKTAELQMNELKEGSYCLSIWYWCTSMDNNRLKVSFINRFDSVSRTTPIIDKSCDTPYRWKLLEASYDSKSEYFIQIIGAISGGFLALDELTIYEGSCTYQSLIDETCTFDDGTDCGIDVVSSPFYNWRIEKGLSLSPSIVDKSTNTPNGKLLALDVNPYSRVDSTSYFYLADLPVEDNYCISFSYLIKGQNELSIWKTKRDEIDSLTTPLYTCDGSFGPSWFRSLVQIDSVDRESDIVFGGSYTSGSSGLIGIDDIKVSQGECITKGFCNFDDTCDWESLPKGKWLMLEDSQYEITGTFLVDQAKFGGTLGFPRRDSSFRETQTKYAYLYDGSGILASPLIYVAGYNSVCLSFAHASDKEGIDILVEQQQDKAYFFQNIESDVDLRVWIVDTLTIPLRPSHSRSVRLLLSSKVYAALDDISVKVGPCPDQYAHFTCSDGSKIHNSFICDYKKDCPKGEDELNCGTCEFTSDACGYVNRVTWSAQAWKVKNNNIELEQNRLIIGSQTSGIIVSQLIQGTSSTCKVEFSYAKHANDQLTVLLLINSQNIEIWSNDLITEKASWNKVTIELGRIRTPFQLAFKGDTTFRIFEYQQVSINYIRFIDCDFKSTDVKDPDSIFTCSGGQTILTSKVCDSTEDCRYGEDENYCDSQTYTFEDGLTSLASTHIWTASSSNGLLSHKPTLDHTRRSPTGSYALLSSENIHGNENYLIGPQLNSTENCLIIFYYYLISPAFSVQVSLKSSEKEIPLQTIGKPSNFGFKQVTIPLKSGIIQPPFAVKFTGVYGSHSPSSYLALDDLTFSAGCFGINNIKPSHKPKPDPKPESKFCKSNEFHCKVNDKCIPLEKSCNYANDCSDGEDEKYCGSCEFDNNDLCGWINEGSNIWIPMNLSTAQLEGFPSDVESPETFLAVTGSFERSSAALRSPLLGVTSPLCTFKFKYHLSGEAKLTLRIKQEKSLVSKVIEQLDHQNSSDSKKWVEGQIELSLLTFDHYLQFVLDTPPSDTFLISCGLADFEMLYCDPSKINFDSFNCLFDTNSCGWTDAGSKGLGWSLTTNETYIDKPKFGFGLKSNRNHPTFINLDISPDHNSNAVRTLTSPWQYATETLCFSFDYRLLSFDETKFTLIIETPGSILKSLFMKSGEPNYGWNHGSVTIKGVTEFRLIFRTDLSPNSGETVVSLDNFVLSSGSCGVHQASCDFSTGTCDWVNHGWTVTEKQQVSSVDGEYHEYFLRNYGANTPTLTLEGSNNEKVDKCLSFWYLHTFNVSSDLKVNFVDDGRTFLSKIVPDHEVANIWTYYRTDVMMIGDDFEISILAEPSKIFDTTAIDDITIYNEPCDTPGNCNFNYDLCGWKSKNIVKWRRNSDVTPSTDNELADKLDFESRGWFIFVRTKDLIDGHPSTLESSRLDLITPVCFSFSYLFTSGGQSNENNITLKVLDTHTESTKELLLISDDGLIEWRTIEKTIRTTNPFKLLFVAASDNEDNSKSSDIALDDFKFTSGKCENDVETTTIIDTTTKTIMFTTIIPTTPEPSTTEQELIEPTEPTVEPPETNTKTSNPTSLATANTIYNIIKQNSILVVGILVVVVLLPLVFVIRRALKPYRSYQPNENITASNKVYDAILGKVTNPKADSIYEEVDSSVGGPSLQFEMRNM